MSKEGARYFKWFIGGGVVHWGGKHSNPLKLICFAVALPNSTTSIPYPCGASKMNMRVVFLDYRNCRAMGGKKKIRGFQKLRRVPLCWYSILPVRHTPAMDGAGSRPERPETGAAYQKSEVPWPFRPNEAQSQRNSVLSRSTRGGQQDEAAHLHTPNRSPSASPPVQEPRGQNSGRFFRNPDKGGF
jgi:hypothetical protein